MILEEKMFACIHCNAKFTKEKTLLIHSCEPKRRHLAQNEKHVIIGYKTYNRFFQLVLKEKELKSYENFSKSPYYNGMVKFGSFINNTHPLYPDKFIDYVITSGVKLDHWCREELYEKYVLHLIHNESVDTALERSIKHMTVWAENNNSSFNHYFNFVSTNRAMYDIKDGKISPWLILNSLSGKKMLDQFDDIQLSAISNIIDPKVWLAKFKQQRDDLELVKHIIKEAHL